MKKYLILFALLSVSFLLSCMRNDGTDGIDSSDELFSKSVELIKIYMDSIDNAKDSVQFKDIIRNFDSKITNLNYEYPPDTDLKMSEEENDSLIKLFKILQIKKLRRDSIINKHISLDSISTIQTPDSLKDN